jgi:glutaredoxin
MKKITFYTKQNCPLCEEAKSLLQIFQADHDFEIEEIDIYSDERLLEKYQISIPVVKWGEYELDGSEMDYVQLTQFFEKIG